MREKKEMNIKDRGKQNPEREGSQKREKQKIQREKQKGSVVEKK